MAFKVVLRRGPAGRIGRRDEHEHRAFCAVIAADMPLDVQRPAVIAELHRHFDRTRAGKPVAAAAFGQAGVGMMTSLPASAVMASAIWIACMPEPVTKNSSAAKARPNCAS